MIYSHLGDIKSVLLPHSIGFLVYPHSDNASSFNKEFLLKHDFLPVFLSSFWTAINTIFHTASSNRYKAIVVSVITVADGLTF